MAKYSIQIREEELKNKVAADFFADYDTTQIVGNIDFAVAESAPGGALDLFDADFFLLGEAKKGNTHDIDNSLVQLLMTILKAKTFNTYLPPLYLAAFDAERIAFLPYDTDLQQHILLDQHLENTIDWKSVTPSDHHAAAFQQVRQQAAPLLARKMLFDFDKDEQELRLFIRTNFKTQQQGTNKINITINRMTAIFNRWLEIVKPTIKIDWGNLAKENILPADFFLADALSKNNWSLGESLKVLLRTDFYMMNLKVRVGDAIMDTFTNVQFTDKQRAHQAFWNRYNRPPSRHERDRMQVRRDLLVEPDRRERKGAFFTPHRWVELSQEYLRQALGDDWQEHYYVWDCCAGTGNLLYGLTERERIFASTLDDADVRFMQQQDFLLPRHVFQFDFLNDDLHDPDKVPADLRRILADPEERKRLVIYINPPYAEAASATQVTGTGKNKGDVANTRVRSNYKKELGSAGNELFAQFFLRIAKEIPYSVLAEFSTLKILQASNFRAYRKQFIANIKKLFLVPADTFDNVEGHFPIGFFVWRVSEPLQWPINADVYDRNAHYLWAKEIVCIDNVHLINKWYSQYYDSGQAIGIMNTRGNDFQNHNYIRITSIDNHNHTNIITPNNLLPSVIYLAVRHCIEATWLNDRDQFLYPNDGWQTDREFQTDCLVYTIFHGQNRITSADGVNHWIPFTEREVGAQQLFASHFMSDYLRGAKFSTSPNKAQSQTSLFVPLKAPSTREVENFAPLSHLSADARAVLDAGRNLWRYYHQQPEANPDASYYDIRRHFQGTDPKGRMNPDSRDAKYMRLWADLKEAEKRLASHIEPKVYAYGFLLNNTLQPTTAQLQLDMSVAPSESQ